MSSSNLESQRQLAALLLTRRRLLAGTAATGALAALNSRPSIVGAQDDPKTLTVCLDGSSSDLDPQSANDYRSEVVIRGMYENLIRLKDDKVDQYEGVIAESWESNTDQSVWTFHIRSGVTFQD